MPALIAKIFKIGRYSLMFSVMVFVYVILAMVYTGKSVPPFGFIIAMLMPWKQIHDIPAGDGLVERLAFMQGLLDASIRVSNVSLLVMTGSFALFSIYLTFVYQQRHRRVRENKLLLIKNREIARRNEFIRYISATISHEFKNNLGRIKRRLDLLPDLDKDAKERIDGNLKKLFADIDIFKRISDERESDLVDFTMVDLKRTLRDIANQYSDLAETTFQNHSSLPWIYASVTLLKTVFENLFDNAIKYKKPDQERAIISVSCSIDRDGTRRYVTISFKDKGVGMDERQAERCFYEGKSDGSGWGQGLYFAKYVVGLHAGKIRAGKEHTSLGTGSEIIIHLPFVEEV